MIEFMRAGGMGMFLVLALGVGTLLVAVLFAKGADERRMALLRALTVATLLSMLTAVASNLSMVMYASQRPEFANAPHFERIIMVGIGESLAPVILGGGLLTIAWLVAAVGVRRLALRLDPLAA